MELSNDSTNPVREVLTIAKIRSVLKNERPRILLTYTPKVNIYCSLAARTIGIPVIANISGLGRAFVSKGWVQMVSRVLYKFALMHPRVLFFQNNDDLREFAQSNLVDVRKAERLPGSGVDLKRFCPPIHRSPHAEFRFLFTSRLLWDKGVAEYVEAAARLKAEFAHVRCRLLGFPEVANPSAVPRRDVDRWHDTGVIEYLGWTDDVIPFLTDADCVVLPSYYREGVPRSLLEAASMALPIIAADMPGCRDVIDDGVTGYLCKPRSADDLAEKMRQMILLPENARKTMGSAARQKMTREFDEEKVISKYLQAVSRILPIEK
jgi:glycosyltransferase involved in cell wall biosynthesis